MAAGTRAAGSAHTARWLIAALAVLALVLAACEADEEPTADVDDDVEEPDTDDTDDTDDPDDPDGTDDADDAAEADGDPIPVGIVTSTSGLLASYGEDYLEGLEAGLEWATGGTGAVDGRPVEFDIVDDGGEPDQAISSAVDLVGEGVTILGGTVSSGVAVQMASFAEENQILYLSGPAATDAITGVNDYTFRSGRQTWQDVAAAAALVDDLSGETVVAFVQDSEFGESNVLAVEAVLGDEMGADVEVVDVPLSATEFTPFAQQIADADPSLVFVAWAGDTTPAMWETLEQQGILDQFPVTTGLAERVTWPLYGPAGPEIQFLNHYFGEAPDNEVNDFLVDHVGGTADIFHADGFVAAQMIVHALSEADPEDVDGMAEALRGWTFDAPKGEQTIRAEDHAMLQPMFLASMENMDDDPDNIDVELLDTLAPEVTEPPIAE